ncbi:MAG: hypothetical protein IJ727_05505, partial [Treponema sp.]|nr:hypothetical protein [Treponema sp.]
GCFQSMFDEYYDTVSSGGLGQIQILNTMMESIVSVNATYVVDTYENFTNLNKSKDTELRMRTHFAVSFVKGKENESSADRKEKVRNAFNAPIRPFVLATTSIGQEGLDFHNYCRKIVHWNLPNNAIDLEQREGRINRYKCLAIRQSLVSNFDIEKNEKGFIWDLLYSKAEKTRPIGKSELYPYWCLGNKETIKIERIVFQYPLSLDQPSYKALKDVLLNYRLTLGQPNQEDLINFLKEQNLTEEEKKQLCINLSPFDK